MPTNMPHDSLFRQMMRFRSFQQAFAQRHVPQQIQHVVDLKQLQQLPAHFCQAHKSVIPDCVLSAPFKQGPGRFYLVTEQETNPRPAVIVRLMLAKLRIIEFDLCHAQGESVPPLVWSLLLCTGPNRYKGRLDLFEGLHASVKPLVKESFVALPQVYHVKDTADVTNSCVPELDATELLMKHIRDPHFEQVLQRFEPLLGAVMAKQHGRVMLNALLSYVIAHGKVGDTYDKIEEKGVLHGKLEEIYMTIAQALQRKGEQLGLQKGEQLGLQKGEQLGLQKGEQLGLQKGEQLGLQKGREKGREEGKILGFEEGRLQIAQNMLRAGIEPKTIAATTGLSPKRIAALSKTK